MIFAKVRIDLTGRMKEHFASFEHILYLCETATVMVLVHLISRVVTKLIKD